MPLPASPGSNAAPANFQIVSRWSKMVRIHTWSMDRETAGRNRAKDVIVQIIRLGAGWQSNQDRPPNAPNGGCVRPLARAADDTAS